MKDPNGEIYDKSNQHKEHNAEKCIEWLQPCRWRYGSTFIRLAVVASQICEIPPNSLKIRTYTVQGHPMASILVSIETSKVHM